MHMHAEHDTVMG